MTRQEIYKTLINILRPESLRTEMVFKPDSAKVKIINLLRSTELKFVGSGIYSVVVEHKDYPNRVFKVSTSRWDGYREYAKYCIEHQGQYMIPTIYSSNVQGNFSWYEIEKYHECTKSTLTSSGIVQYVSSKIHNEVKVLQYYSSPNTTVHRKTIELLIDTNGMNSKKLNEHINNLQNMAIKVKEICNIFNKNFTVDMHCGNIMLDSKNDIVITDPLASNKSREIPVTEEDPIF